jgi:hypothetical protein
VGREDLTWVILVLVLLIGGLFVGQRLSVPQPDDDRLADSTPFRQWMWEWRSLDLAVQAGLILTGALAIAALLPREGETGGEAPTGTQDKTR